MERYNHKIGRKQRCAYCKSGMKVDSRLCLFVCTNCGWCVKTHYSTIYEKFGMRMGRWHRRYSYDRKAQFRGKMTSRGGIPISAQIMMTHRFALLNKFYANEILNNDIYNVKRKNILKYEYIIHKMLQLTKRHDWAAKFESPKTKRKIKEYERIWWMLCEHFDWTFYDDIAKRKTNRLIQLSLGKKCHVGRCRGLAHKSGRKCRLQGCTT